MMLGNQDIDKILEISPFACVLMADNYHIKYMNPIMSEFLSLEKDNDLTGFPFLEYLPDDDRESFIEFITQLDSPVKDQLWKVFRIVDSQGNPKKILMNGTNNLEKLGATGTFFLVGMPLFNSTLQNILPDHMEKNLFNKFSYNKYESIFDSATVGITIFNEKGVVEETNQTFIDQLGYSKQSTLDKHYSEFFQEEVKETFENLMEMIKKHKQDHVKDVITLEKNDNRHMILEISLSRIFNEYQNVNKIMMITEDITDQKDTHAALLQSEKLALTGRLAASLAHEINNPLQTSIGCLGLAEEMLVDDDRDLKVYIRMAIEEIQRSARIVKRLRDLNRKASFEDKAPVNLQEILEDVLLLTKNRLYDRNIVPIFPYQGPAPVVLASKDQIQQVVLNLMMNAIDAIPHGGQIYVDMINTKNPKGVRVKIRDTGVGMNEEVLSHLFDPFFTTKEDGMGLGLYICKQILEDHVGSLNVESEPGKGTAISFWLPGIDISEDEE